MPAPRRKRKPGKGIRRLDSWLGVRRRFGGEIAKVSDNIDATLASLDALVETEGDDLATPFEAYAKSVKALEEEANGVRELAKEMEARGDEFFAEWETDETSEVSPARRSKLTDAYRQIKESTTAAGAAFDPFLASLKDIESYLKLDLTRRSLASLTEVVAEGRTNGAEVKSLISKVLQEVNSVRGMLSTKPSS